MCGPFVAIARTGQEIGVPAKRVVEDIETRVEAGGPRYRIRGDEGRGRIPGRLERLGQSGNRLLQRGRGVVAKAVLEGKQSGEQARMRGSCLGGLNNRIFKDDASRGHRVQRGRGR